MYSYGVRPFERLETSPVIVSIDAIGEVVQELAVAVVVVTLDGGFLDRPVHAFDLAVRSSFELKCLRVSQNSRSRFQVLW